MRKIAFLSVVLLMSTGCRGGLLSRIFRGDACGSGCTQSLPPAPVGQDCSSCNGGVSAGYGNYEGEIVGGDYVGSGAISSGPVITDGYYGTPVEGSIINGGLVPIESVPSTGSGTTN